MLDMNFYQFKYFDLNQIFLFHHTQTIISSIASSSSISGRFSLIKIALITNATPTSKMIIPITKSTYRTIFLFY